MAARIEKLATVSARTTVRFTSATIHHISISASETSPVSIFFTPRAATEPSVLATLTPAAPTLCLTVELGAGALSASAAAHVAFTAIAAVSKTAAAAAPAADVADDDDEDDIAAPAAKRSKAAVAEASPAKASKKAEKAAEATPAKKEKKEVAETTPAKKEKKEASEAKAATPAANVVKVLPGGTQYRDEDAGTGAAIRPGSRVSIRYTGMLPTGKVFDSNMPRGTPLTFNAGSGEVIKGMDLGVIGMRKGGRRRLIIPPNQGYGASGSPPVIPGNATLIFDIEIVSFK